MPECKACLYFKRIDARGQSGQCRRNPPVVVVLSHPGRGPGAVTRWPDVEESDGCGEHSGIRRGDG